MVLCICWLSTGDKVKNVRLRFLVSSFIVLERDLHSKKVLLSKCRILNDLELDILVTERLVASLCFARLASIIAIISAI
jgi:hypothetical protein